MSASIQLKFDPADVAALQAQMERRVRILGDSPADAVRIGTIALLRSMQASTKVAPRRRKVTREYLTVVNTSTGKSRRRRIKHSYVAEGLDTRTGSPMRIPIRAWSLAEAKMHPRARIKRWGLAKASWGWAMQQLFGGSIGGARADLPRPASAIETSKMIDRVTGYAEAIITNRLGYISRALSGGRGPAVSTAMARAAATMRSRIDQAVKRATMEAGY